MRINSTEIAYVIYFATKMLVTISTPFKIGILMKDLVKSNKPIFNSVKFSKQIISLKIL